GSSRVKPGFRNPPLMATTVFLSGATTIFRAMSLTETCVPAGLTPQPLKSSFEFGLRPGRVRISGELTSSSLLRTLFACPNALEQANQIKRGKTANLKRKEEF